MYTEQKLIDKIEILEDGTIQIREVTRVLKDGVQIAETYHRKCFAPTDSVDELSAKVVSIANLVRTPEVVSKYVAEEVNNRTEVDKIGRVVG